MTKKNSWFKIKRYPHIGIPIDKENIDKLISYISNPLCIQKHSFSPFIFSLKEQRRFRRRKDDDNIVISKERFAKIKERPICYGNNLDSNIFSYYSKILNENYEVKLVEYDLEQVVTAYRPISMDPSNKDSRNKCNIDFAEEVFNYIRDNESNKLSALALDITGFFDNLDHSVLKKKWRQIMNFEGSLPPDHYNVFKNLTKYSYVFERDIFKQFQDSIWVQKPNGKIKRERIEKFKFLKNKGAIAFCRKQDINILRDRNYIKKNIHKSEDIKSSIGIPQGSPLSAILANIYLFDFDNAVNKFINSKHGLYRRYSDDLVIVVQSKYEKEVLNFIEAEIKKTKLEIKKEKTQAFRFIRCESRYFCFERIASKNIYRTNNNFDYLGFSFDGKYTYLKSSVLSKYYRKMKRAIKRGWFFSQHTNVEKRKGEIFYNRLYKGYTHLGKNRRLKFKRHPTEHDQFIVTKENDWGNFLSYAYMASRIMRNNKIRSQVKNHWKIFHTSLHG